MITAEGRKQEGTKEMSLFNPLSLFLPLCLLNNGWNRMKKTTYSEFSAGVKREHFENNVVSVLKTMTQGDSGVVSRSPC